MCANKKIKASLGVVHSRNLVKIGIYYGDFHADFKWNFLVNEVLIL